MQIVSGRRDWDYVAFADYQSDMKEGTDRAVAVIDVMQKRAENAERVLAEIVLAAGGCVGVSDHILQDRHRKVELTIWRNEKDMTLEYEARVVSERAAS